MSNSSQEVIEIGDKFKSSSELLKNIESNLSNVTNVEGKDKEAHEALPVVVGRLSQLSAEWYQQWAKILLETGADLGTITSYVGSVFKPQEIPVAQMILCVVSDMEMEIKDILSSDQAQTKDGCTQILNKIVCIIATFRFIDQSQAKEKLEAIKFPCTRLYTSLQEIIECYPDFEKRIETIGM